MRKSLLTIPSGTLAAIQWLGDNQADVIEHLRQLVDPLCNYVVIKDKFVIESTEILPFVVELNDWVVVSPNTTVYIFSDKIFQSGFSKVHREEKENE